jgi:3-oxoacyl-[acyl-carrier protein] reductase
MDINTSIMTTLLLKDRVAVVTGAGSGIGAATARAFAAAGASVALAGRDVGRLQASAEAIRSATPDAQLLVVPTDLTDATAVRDMAQQTQRHFKRVDILVHAAGVMLDARIGMVTPEQMEATFRTNVFGALQASAYASRLMARVGGGSIVFIGSIMGVEGNAGQSVYAGSKAALIGAAKSLAKELAAQNIRVNVIAPGFIETPLTQALAPEVAQAVTRSIRMGRAGRADEVAQVALFLASDMASYVTGQTLGVDGSLRI